MKVCRTFVIFVCLTATTIVCQAKSEYFLNGPVTVTNSIDKSGDGTLKVYSEAQNSVCAESWVISSGRVDCQGYFGMIPDDVVVESGAAFSAEDTEGDCKANGSGITVESLGIVQFEFDSSNESIVGQNVDTITIGSVLSQCAFTLEQGAVVQLAFSDNDAESWAKANAEFQQVVNPIFAINKDYSNLLSDSFGELFQLAGRKNQESFLIGRSEPEPISVPEFSTWALLALGVAGLVCLRKLR